MTQKKGYIKKEERKRILFISDDIRWHSGIATVSRELIAGTAHHFSYFTIGGAINHPDKGKIINMSQAVNEIAKIDDSDVFLLPFDGYGNPDVIRSILSQNKVDAIVFITDPRYYTWLFEMEHEIRTGMIGGNSVKMVYIQIWDEFPVPYYNRDYYLSVDMSLCISKQTKLINEMALGEDSDLVWLRYFPHGINHNYFKPLDMNDPKVQEGQNQIKKSLFGDKQYDFMFLFNSRNIRRKSISDTILAFKAFLKKLTKEKADKCVLVLHTQPLDENGTDLPAVIEYIMGEDKNQVVFSNVVGTVEYMNHLYNMADATVLLSSNEGFGLSGAESIMAGTPVIGNVTGGIQDYARFEDENGNWFTPSEEIWSNHLGNFKKCGPWFHPVFPSNLSIQGSIPTPYIFDSRVDYRDAADVMYEVYNIDRETRKQNGLKGREWMMSDESKMSVDKMSESFIEEMDSLFEDDYVRHSVETLKVPAKKPLKHIPLPDYLFKK